MPFLLVPDDADNVIQYWPGKYKFASNLDDTSMDASLYLPENEENGSLLITTRDSRVVGRLVKQGKPIVLPTISRDEARQLFLSNAEADCSDYTDNELEALLHGLDYLPLAISLIRRRTQSLVYSTIYAYAFVIFHKWDALELRGWRILDLKGLEEEYRVRTHWNLTKITRKTRQDRSDAGVASERA